MQMSRFTRTTIAARITAAVAFLLVGATALRAQEHRPDWWDPGLFVGVGAGPAVVPDIFLPGCAGPDGSLRLGLAAGGEALIPVGSSAIELRSTAIVPTPGGVACPLEDPIRADGTYTDRTYGHRGDGLIMFDARFRAYPFGNRKAHVSVGAGAEMFRGSPYLVVGAGWQTAGRIRTGVDVDLRALTVAYNEVTRVWNGGAPVTLLSQESGRELQLVGVVRLFFEIRLRDRGARPAPARTAPY